MALAITCSGSQYVHCRNESVGSESVSGLPKVTVLLGVKSICVALVEPFLFPMCVRLYSCCRSSSLPTPWTGACFLGALGALPPATSHRWGFTLIKQHQAPCFSSSQSEVGISTTLAHWIRRQRCKVVGLAQSRTAGVGPGPGGAQSRGAKTGAQLPGSGARVPIVIPCQFLLHKVIVKLTQGL